MGDFGADLRRFAEKTEEKLEDVDVGFKLGLFNRVVMLTRVADPSTWKRPDPTYIGGQMRGNWQVSTGAPAGAFLEGRKVAESNMALLPEEAAQIAPFSATYLTNNTPYVTVWEEVDGMTGRAIAEALQILQEAARDA